MSEKKAIPETPAVQAVECTQQTRRGQIPKPERDVSMEISTANAYLSAWIRAAESAILKAMKESEAYLKYAQLLPEIAHLPRVFLNHYFPMTNYMTGVQADISSLNTEPLSEETLQAVNNLGLTDSSRPIYRLTTVEEPSLFDIDEDTFYEIRERQMNQPDLVSLRWYIELLEDIIDRGAWLDKAKQYIEVYALHKKNDMKIIDDVILSLGEDSDDIVWLESIKTDCQIGESKIADSLMARAVPSYIWYRDSFIFDRLKTYLLTGKDEELQKVKEETQGWKDAWKRKCDEVKEYEAKYGKKPDLYQHLNQISGKVYPSKIIIEVDYDHKAKAEKRTATKILVSYEDIDGDPDERRTSDFTEVRTKAWELLYQLAEAIENQSKINELLEIGKNTQKVSALNSFLNALFNLSGNSNFIDHSKQEVKMQLKLRNRRAKQGASKSLSIDHNPPSEQGE